MELLVQCVEEGASKPDIAWVSSFAIHRQPIFQLNFKFFNEMKGNCAPYVFSH